VGHRRQVHAEGLAGDVTAEEVKADAEATYGKVPVRADIARAVGRRSRRKKRRAR